MIIKLSHLKIYAFYANILGLSQILLIFPCVRSLRHNVLNSGCIETRTENSFAEIGRTNPVPTRYGKNTLDQVLPKKEKNKLSPVLPKCFERK